MKTIIFVCSGNIQRSVIAAEILKNILLEQKLSHQYQIVSRGLQGSGGRTPPKHAQLKDYPVEWEASRPAIEALGINIDDYVSTPISRDDADDASVIIAMNESVLSIEEANLVNQFSDLLSKLHHYGELDETVGVVDLADEMKANKHQLMIFAMNDLLRDKWQTIISWCGE